MSTTPAPDPAKRERAIRLNLLMLRLTRRWLRVALIIIAIYVTLPVAAPTLMEVGLTGPARVLYTLYSPFCHQFAFRTLFLFGEQPAYPRAIAGTELRPYEDYITGLPEFAAIPDPTEFSPQLQFASRDFLGNAEMGYKMTLCARDIAIYGAILVGGLIYSIPVVRRRLRPVPILLYLFLGLGPIGIDGFSQLLGYPPFNLWPPRETTPFFRILTGTIFGLMNAWLAFPYLEASFRETQEQIEDKLRRAGIPF